MKITNLLFTIAFLILHAGLLNGQTSERCQSSYLHHEQQANPNVFQQRQAMEASIQGILDNDPNFRVSGGVITIPVVFHVLYNTPAENISMAKIQSQLDVLNRDFRKMNADTASMPSVWAPLIADAEIEFCLATIDPNGNPTDGVTRTATTVTTFLGYTDMKYDVTGGKNAWPKDDYMNVWVCDLVGYTAFGQFPGFDPATDGVAIDYQAFGTIGNVIGDGRLMVHEAGHWLHLYHIWGDGFFPSCASDSVSDTPPQDDWSNGCPTFPQHDVCSSTGSGTMFMNYMDYTNDNCMNSFTNGQVARMHAALQVLRPSILNSTKCEPITNISVGTSTGVELYPNPAKDRLMLTFSNSLEVEASIRVLNSFGQIMKTIVSQATGEVSLDLDISDLVPGVYFLELRTSEGSAVKKFIKSR